MVTPPPMRHLGAIAALFVGMIGGGFVPMAAGGEVHKALQDGATEKALALLANDPALVESQDDLQQTPLHVAVYRNRSDAVTWLLAHGAKVNSTAYNKYTPLHLASNVDIAKALIKAGADLDAVDTWGNTPIQSAAQRVAQEYKADEFQAVIDAILASGYKLDLRTAIMLKKRDLVKRMLKENPELAKRASHGSNLWGSTTPLGIAASQRDRELVQLLLDAGADANEGTDMPNAGGDASALTNAVWANDKEIVDLLLKHGARTDVVGGKFYVKILDYARVNADPQIVKLLEQAQGRAGEEPAKTATRKSE